MYAAFNAMSGRAVPRKSRSRRQNLVRPAQLRVLRPQLFELRHRIPRGPFRLRGGRRVRLVAPPPERFRRYPQILRHLFYRLRLRRIRGPGLRQQPDRLRLELVRVSRALCHGSIISHRVRGNAEQKSVHINSWARPKISNPGPISLIGECAAWRAGRAPTRRPHRRRALVRRRRARAAVRCPIPALP